MALLIIPIHHSLQFDTLWPLLITIIFTVYHYQPIIQLTIIDHQSWPLAECLLPNAFAGRLVLLSVISGLVEWLV